jgi:hypothetical protein
MDNDKMFSLIAAWSSIRLVLVMSLLHGWHTRQIDYVQAYTQADIECDMYMHLPKGFEVPDNEQEYVLRIKKNIYGQKQAGHVWNNHLTQTLCSIGFKPSIVDDCVFYRGKSVYILYTDDSILVGPNQEELDQIIVDMKNAGLDLTVDGDIGDFLGVKIDRHDDGTCILSQPHLIDSILQDLRLHTRDKDGNVRSIDTKPTPAASSTILKACLNSKPFDGHFNYHSVVGKANYLEKCTCPDISVALQVEGLHQHRWIQANQRSQLLGNSS